MRFAILLLVALSATAVAAGVTADYNLHPEEIELLAGEKGMDPEELAENVVYDVALPAVEQFDPDTLDVVDEFIQKSGSSVLGRKWDKFKAEVKRQQRRILRREAKKVAAKKDVFSAQEHHGLTPLEYRYMRLYKKYKKLSSAYATSTSRARFWKNLKKWHWRVLLASSKKLNKLVKAYKRERKAYRTLGKRLNRRFAFASHRAPYKTRAFYRRVIAHSKKAAAAASVAQDKANKESKTIKEEAKTVANQMKAARVLDVSVGALARKLDAVHEELE